MLHNQRVETRRLQVLLELSRLGSMRSVADELGTTTSTVSQQIAKLGRETGTALIEPDGRRVRLTPAGRRLAAHAAIILAAVDAARLDLDPDADPAGTVHVSGFATAIRATLLPVVADLGDTHPRVKVIVYEHEPAEALARLSTDDVDLALTYDYNLAPAGDDPRLQSLPLWSRPWSLGVPDLGADRVAGTTLEVFDRFRHHDWIGNSRNRADEDVVRILASMTGFEPRVKHHTDSLELVEDLILSGMGIGLLPSDRRTRPGIALLTLHRPEVRLRAYARVREGRQIWPPLALVLGCVLAHAHAGT